MHRTLCLHGFFIVNTIEGRFCFTVIATGNMFIIIIIIIIAAAAAVVVVVVVSSSIISSIIISHKYCYFSPPLE